MRLQSVAPMAKVRNPETVSGAFDIDPDELDRLAILDATLAIDTKLFIDPLLLSQSQHAEIREKATSQYRRHFEMVITFLTKTEHHNDMAWRTARRHLEFHEIRGTCLGYGAGSIQGSGFGPALTERVLDLGKEIVDLGITDPDLFPAMALLEDDIGPDRISDMTTNIIHGALIDLNRRILSELGLKGMRFSFPDGDGIFLVNPSQRRTTPVILVPVDVLRRLPIVRDWDGIADAASRNVLLRHRVNQHISHIWAAKTKRDKRRLREQVLATRKAFQAFLDAIHTVPQVSYDAKDPDALVRWARIAKEFAKKIPLRVKAPKTPLDLDSAHSIVKEIVVAFRQLIENNGLNKELYHDGKPRRESTTQRLFFAIAYSYCKANNLDISPEADSGSGQIDFKFSRGFDCRVLVEIKLSTNTRLVRGYSSQLETYKKAEQTTRAIYLVIDIGQMGEKDDALVKMRNEARERGEPLADLEFVDGIVKPSASRQ